MGKLTRLIVGITLAITVLFGLDQLSYKNDVFAESLYPCCQAGYCDQAPCSMLVSVEIYPEPCTGYVVSCETCVIYMAAGRACGTYTADDCCIESDNSLYCGDK